MEECLFLDKHPFARVDTEDHSVQVGQVFRLTKSRFIPLT